MRATFEFNPLRILYFSPHPHINMASPSGPGTHIREIIEGFEAQGHIVIRFIAGGETALPNTSTISFRRSPWKRFIPSIFWETLRDFQMIFYDKKLQRRLETIILNEKPDIIYERSCYGMGAGMRAAAKLGVRYIVEMNAPYPQERVAMQGRSLLSFRGHIHEKKQVESAYRTIVVSTAMKRYLLEKTKSNQQSIHVAANAVNPKHIQTSSKQIADIRSSLGLSIANTIIGFVGSIFPYHGVDLMIESFVTIAQEYPESRMLIVGDGEIVKDLKKRAEDLGLSQKIIFTGNVPHKEVYNYLSLMDIAVMARSNWYGSPVKIFEYGAMRKAIIAPNVVPVTDVMIHREHGLLISDSQAELTDAIRYMLKHPDERQRMAENFHLKVLSEHTWNKVANDILNSFQ